MTEIIVNPTKSLQGVVIAPSSKSYTQRMLIGSALSNGKSVIQNPLFSEDTNATIRAVQSLGAQIIKKDNQWIVNGSLPLKGNENPINCGESGATLRFILPVCALAGESSTLVFAKSLEKRPILPLLESLEDLGVKTEKRSIESKPAILVHGGGIRGGKTSIVGDISSQFISGLLFACPMASFDTVVNLKSPLESTGYVEMTNKVLENHKISINVSSDYNQFNIKSNQRYIPNDSRVPGDFSSAAFLLSAGAITNSKVTVKNLDAKTLQGDKAILSILEDMGVNLRISSNQVEVDGYSDFLKSLDINVRDIPDLVPICSVLACYANGISKIHDARRLRYKESNRLLSLYLELRKMGADISLKEDSLIINASQKLNGAIIDPHDDHRIAMACAVAALGADGKTKILDSNCVNKSYPSFFRDLENLGVDISGK